MIRHYPRLTIVVTTLAVVLGLGLLAAPVIHAAFLP
jgi:hypothetical protein